MLNYFAEMSLLQMACRRKGPRHETAMILTLVYCDIPHHQLTLQGHIVGDIEGRHIDDIVHSKAVAYVQYVINRYTTALLASVYFSQQLMPSLIAKYMGPIWGRRDPGGPHEPCYLG